MKRRFLAATLCVLTLGTLGFSQTAVQIIDQQDRPIAILPGAQLDSLVAPIALLTAKGGITHRRWGKIYF